jgi:hypothetical protein
MDALTKAQHTVAESLYKNAQASGGGQAPPDAGAGASSQPSGGKEGEVIDAEVVDDK